MFSFCFSQQTAYEIRNINGAYEGSVTMAKDAKVSVGDVISSCFRRFNLVQSFVLERTHFSLDLKTEAEVGKKNFCFCF